MKISFLQEKGFFFSVKRTLPSFKSPAKWTSIILQVRLLHRQISQEAFVAIMFNFSPPFLKCIVYLYYITLKYNTTLFCYIYYLSLGYCSAHIQTSCLTI